MNKVTEENEDSMVGEALLDPRVTPVPPDHLDKEVFQDLRVLLGCLGYQVVLWMVTPCLAHPGLLDPWGLLAHRGM